MAYFNNIYPNYSYNYQQNYQPNRTIQDGGFVSVRSEEEAKSCPIAHGTSIMFKDETAPYIYTKTLGFGQFDSPTFEKYRLIKETPQNAQKDFIEEKAEDLPIYVTKSEFEPFREELERLKEKMGQLRKELGDE